MAVAIIAWIALGLIAGIIAKSLVGGPDKHGLLIMMLVGIAGALAAGALAAILFHIDYNHGLFDITTCISATVGAFLLLLVHHGIIHNSPNFIRRHPHQ